MSTQPVSSTDDALSDDILDMDMDIDMDTEDTGLHLDQDIDARRRLEDKLEEMRLRRELREFDFDS